MARCSVDMMWETNWPILTALCRHEQREIEAIQERGNTVCTPFLFAWAKAARVSRRSMRSSRASSSRRSSMGTTVASARPHRCNRTRSLPNAARLIASANPFRSLFPAEFPLARLHRQRPVARIDRLLERCEQDTGSEAKLIDERTAHAPFPFFGNSGMKWVRQLCRGAILLIHTVEETFNGQGYDTEENDQEKACKNDEGKARRQDCEKERLIQPLLRPFRPEQHPLRPSTCVNSKARTLMVALRHFYPPAFPYLITQPV